VRELAALVTQAKVDLLTEYRNVTSLQPKDDALVARLSHEAQNFPGVLKTYSRIQKRMSALNASFASLLDFVEDRAEEERREVEDGGADQRLLGRMEEEKPEWDKGKRLGELKKAKDGAKKTVLAKVDVRTSLSPASFRATLTVFHCLALFHDRLVAYRQPLFRARRRSCYHRRC
jgi:hypothetical protein